MQTFQWATASVQGREHRRRGRNNQDAIAVLETDHALIALVCDGCGSGQHSEVGAKLGAKWLERAIATHLPLYPQPEFWATVRSQLLDQLRSLLTSLGTNRNQLVTDYCLFTIVGTILTPELTTVFAIGDGVVAINGQVKTWDYPDNAPPYVIYNLQAADDPDWDWQILHHGPTEEIESLLVGTDGVQDLIRNRDRPLPGKTELVGELSQFWTSDRYFTNPDQLRRRLSLINRDVQAPSAQPGLLRDDTSLVVIRRAKGER